MRRIPAVLSTLALSGGLLVALSPAEATIAPTPASMSSVSTKDGTTAVIGSDGRPYGTGVNTSSQLTGPATTLTTLTPLSGFPAGAKATAVVAGFANVVVVDSDANAYASGSNAFNQIAAGSTANKTTLTEIEWLVGEDVQDIDAYDGSIVAVLDDGTIKAAGFNRFSRYSGAGGNSTLGPTVLDPLPGGKVADQVSVGFQGLAVLTTDGAVYTRGRSVYGELSSATGVQETVWTLEDDLPVAALSIDLEDDHLIVLGSDHNVYGSGKNSDGNIGAGGDHDVLAAIPDPPTGAGIVAISTGITHTLAIGDDGRLYGIGNNLYGQLPDHPGSTNASANYSWALLASSLAEDVTGISGGYLATIFIDADGVIRGSGYNTSGGAGQITDGGAGELNSIGAKLLSGQLITNVVEPKISGTAQFTKTLTASPGSWTPTSRDISYQWKVDGFDIVGATGATYDLTPGDIGKKITVEVTAARGRFTDGVETSAETASVALAPALVFTALKPTIKGTFKSGRTLSLSKTTAQLLTGFNPDATTLSYKWYRNGAAIAGATSRTYKLTSKDKGKRVSARVYGKKPFHSPTGSVRTSSVKIQS